MTKKSIIYNIIRYRRFEGVDLFLQSFVFDLEFSNCVLELQNLILKQKAKLINIEHTIRVNVSWLLRAAL